MTGWLHYIEHLAYWYVMFFENKEELKLSSYPLVLSDAMKIPFTMEGQDCSFALIRVKGVTFAKILEHEKNIDIPDCGIG